MTDPEKDRDDRTFLEKRFAHFTHTALKVVKWSQLNVLLVKLTPYMQAVVAILVWLTSFGSRHVGRRTQAKDGKRGKWASYSMINATDDTWRPPLVYKSPAYHFKDFPFVAGAKGDLLDGLHEYRAHSLSFFVKAAYEDEGVFCDIASSEWAPFRCLGMLKTEILSVDELAKAKGTSLRDLRKERRRQLQIRLGLLDDKVDNKDVYRKQKVVESIAPQTRAFIIGNDHAVVLAFRGTEPTNLVQWYTDASCDLVEHEDTVAGRVHEGFYEALFFHSEDGAGPKHAMFRRICEELFDAIRGGKALYITGHSLGGALTSVMAHCIAKLAADNKPIPGWPEGQKITTALMAAIKQNGGVYTFAGPLVGDLVFKKFMEQQFGTDIFRIVHAGDLVPQVPFHSWHFKHHVREYYWDSFGKLWTDDEDIRFAQREREKPLIFLRCYIHKMLRGFFIEGESPVRTLERLGLLFIAPGLTDHWPCDYERNLRKYAIDRALKAAGPAAAQNGVNGHVD